MSLTAVIYLTTAALAVVLVLIVMVTRRVIRTVPGGGDARAVAQLAAEIKRANDLAEGRIAQLEQRLAALEQRGAASRGSVPPAG